MADLVSQYRTGGGRVSSNLVRSTVEGSNPGSCSKPNRRFHNMVISGFLAAVNQSTDGEAQTCNRKSLQILWRFRFLLRH
ncbi:hypothetical protein PoB_001448800 [Plakobranchus ocellatus]|uniref:Uncharacterized protein n=1 Tax=Plakobranchus ocellatus TaxID=259542 RepID=A0AAV3Z0E9_9GAST|nr:hypothetical protein PoB_001448800 [Plakobranchus ocellatus]